MAFIERTLAGINELIAELKQMIINGATPARTVSWFYRDTAPVGWAICDGRTVTMNDGTTLITPNLIDRYIVGKKTSDSIGRTIEAGLPNIVGEFIGSDDNVVGQEVVGWTSGAFRAYVGNDNAIADGGPGREKHVTFDASRSNSIYGNSDTVTPPSIGLLPCIKL